MRKGLLVSIFWGLILIWGYHYPYQWWLKYGHTDRDEPEVTNNYLKREKNELPKTFFGSSLEAPEEQKMVVPGKKVEKKIVESDLAGPVLDEIKICFADGSLNQVSSTGDMNSLVIALQNQMGPVQEDILLEKKAILKMKDGTSRTLVYEWISPDEGSDVYWHDTDGEGFPRPLDLPPGSGHDMATFEKLKVQGSSQKLTETRLLQLQNGLQLGLEKTDDSIQSLSVKDEGHLIKCRKDPVKSFVCDCLN